MDANTAGQWVRTWATDVTPGDLIRIDGEHFRAVDRDYPGVVSPIFRITLPSGITKTLGKLTRLEIFDPDGSVARRVQVIPANSGSSGAWLRDLGRHGAGEAS
jgi:hypothetical protein